MKKKFLILGLLLAMTLACATAQPPAPATSAPSVETLVAGTIQAMTAAAPQVTAAPTAASAPTVNGTAVSFENISFTLPTDAAFSALAGNVPAVMDEMSGSEIPQHVKFELDGYALYDTFFDAQILVYPAPAYAAMNDAAAQSVAALQAIVNGTTAANKDNLPRIVTFNAGQLFAAQIQVVRFANGAGVRSLVEYGQYYATVNNRDLFYQFQGLTSDGKYFILAILPISHPLLAINEKPETVPPTGGLPFPGYDDPDAIAAYYNDATSLLNSAAPNSFQPALTSLDRLIESLNIQ